MNLEEEKNPVDSFTEQEYEEFIKSIKPKERLENMDVKILSSKYEKLQNLPKKIDKYKNIEVKK